MNVKIQYDLEFLAGVHFENRLQLNNYNVSVQMQTGTLDTASINTALERLKCFVLVELADTVFIHQDDARAELLALAGVNITTVPDQPIDQIIGMMLYYKLNAIMGGRIYINRLDISSLLGDDVWYTIDEEYNIKSFTKDGWWNLDTVDHGSLLDDERNEKNVLRVTKNAWAEYGLLWPEDEINGANNTVVYANFPKNEN